MELDPKEADLIQKIRELKFGKMIIVIQKGLPVRIKKGFGDIILGKDLTKDSELLKYNNN